MSEPNRDPSINRTLGLEGGYVNRADDRGGPTNFGVTLATLQCWRGRSPLLSSVDVERLEPDEARAIYCSMWQDVQGDALPAGPDWMVYDMRVTSGSFSARILQRVLDFAGRDVDGWIGAKTLQAVANIDTAHFVWAINSRGIALLQSHLGLYVDGVAGTLTRAALGKRRDLALIGALYSAQSAFYVGLNEASNTAGWLSRARQRFDFALTLAGGAEA